MEFYPAASITRISPLLYLMSLRHRSGKFYIGFNVIDNDSVDGRNLVFNTKRAFVGTVSVSWGKRGKGRLSWESQQAFTALKLGLSKGTISSIRLYRSLRLSATEYSILWRVRGVSSIFLKATTTAIDVRSFYPATFPSLSHIYHKVSPGSPKKTTRLKSAVPEVRGLHLHAACTSRLFLILKYWQMKQYEMSPVIGFQLYALEIIMSLKSSANMCLMIF